MRRIHHKGLFALQIIAASMHIVAHYQRQINKQKKRLIKLFATSTLVPASTLQLSRAGRRLKWVTRIGTDAEFDCGWPSALAVLDDDG